MTEPPHALPLNETVRRAQRPLYVLGLLLLASGLGHIVVWSILGGPWHGPLAWRKPILFGLSAGLTTLSLGWLFGRFRNPWHIDSVFAWFYAVTMGAEVGLITVQTWRGVPSHFNHETPFNEFIYRTMGVLILSATAIIVLLTVRSFGSLRTRPETALAVRSGLLLLVLSCVLGMVIDVIGEIQLHAGHSAELYGSAGILKFPHGMPMHALQWLPLLAWLTAAARWPLGLRLQAVGLAVGGQLVLTAYSLLQTFSGRGRGDVTTLTGALLALGLAGVLLPFVAALATLACAPFRRAGLRGRIDSVRSGNFAD
jgi:hypothetical protein